MNNLKTRFSQLLFLVSLALLANLVWGFTEPSAPAPGNNTPAPLNVGSQGQSKSGGLIINTGGAAYGLIVQNGFVGIGTVNPGAALEVAGQVKITGGAPGAGKILTSDTAGLATWATAAGGLGGGGTVNYVGKFTGTGTIGNSLIFDNGTNVGIGTQAPTQKLDVAGNVKLSGAIMPNGDAGTAGQVLVSQGAGNPQQWIAPFLTNLQVFDASGSFTVPSGVTKVIVEAWGGGGGGSNYPESPIYAGYGSSYTKDIVSVTPNASIPVVVGLGGINADYNDPSNCGHPSSFGTIVVAPGGWAYATNCSRGVSTGRITTEGSIGGWGGAGGCAGGGGGCAGIVPGGGSPNTGARGRVLVWY